VKFSCERCGKKYATAESPAPGRVYKIRCKACGHLIVVKASAGTPAAPTTELRPPTSGGMPAVDLTAPPAPEPEVAPPPPLPDIQLEVGAPEPASPSNGAPAGAPELPDATQEISMAGISAAPAEEAFTPPPGDAGYVDLFAETPKQPEAPAEDPFVAAARASLPESYGEGIAAPDPFASLREELSSPPPPPPPPTPVPRAGAAPSTLPKIPVIPKPAPQQKSALPIALIGAGALVLVGILAFVLLGGSGSQPAPVQPQAAAPRPPAPPPVAAPQPPPAPVEPVAPPQPAEKPRAAERQPDPRADEDRRAREERRARERERERAAREAREARAREEREARERERAAREQRAREEREAREREARERQRREAGDVASANLSDAEGGLSQAQIEKVLGSTRKAFESCIVTSGKSGEVKLDGRRVMLRLNIQTSGAVTYPTLDDVTLNGTELGSCLKSAARLMVFPKFKGDTMHVEVPLVLAGR
jgi:hypothetical protein